MNILKSLRSRISQDVTGEASSQNEGELPTPRYNRLNARDVNAGLHEHSQVELADIEKYERSHEKREVVLGKLRYMRGTEPLEDYDALSAEEISTVLQGADLETITNAREYERKFHRRAEVLEELARLRREHRSAPTTGDDDPNK